MFNSCFTSVFDSCFTSCALDLDYRCFTCCIVLRCFTCCVVLRCFTCCVVLRCLSCCVLQMGNTSHDAVQVPFVLPPNIENEGQFAFSVEGIQMPTKMKGTLTYMVKVGQ